MIKLTNNIEEANAITHAGTFHTDEVLSTVILSKVFENITVFRTNNIQENMNIKPNTIIYDIGLGEFDHHQKGGNGKRENGVPYAACGLIWKKFGKEIVKNYENSEIIWKIIDKKLIQPIDADDNGVFPTLDYPIQNLTFSNIISGFNPKWDNENDNQNDSFIKAVEFATIVFENALENAISQAKAYFIIKEALEKSENNIMILNEHLPWKETLFEIDNPKAKDLLFVVYPSNRGGYNWQCVPESIGSFGQKKSVPSEWKGLYGEELQKISGISTARFCHPNGFIGRCRNI